MSVHDGLLAEAGGRIKVFALTGIRSEYDLLHPVLAAMREDPAFEVGVLACAAHLSPLHGYSVRHIRDDGFRIVAEIESLLYTDSEPGRVRSLGILLSGLAQALSAERPDLLLVLGDREEALAGAIAGSYLRIPVAHLAAGDNTHPVGGNVDEEVRHAITKLSHVFFTMNEEHSRRVVGLGENPELVFTVGNTGLDRLRVDKGVPREELARILGPDVLGEYMVCIHHSLNSEPGNAGREIRLVLDACCATGLPVFVGAPNTDPGSGDIREVIASFAAQGKIRQYSNLPRREFTSLLVHARCLVGNSSLGLHEAPFLGLAAVNVGQRQRGRIHGPNVLFVDAEPGAVSGAIDKALHDEAFLRQVRESDCPYGDGHSAARVIEAVKGLPRREALLAKQITL